MDKFSKPIFPENEDELLAEMKILKRQVYKLQLEVDMVNKAAEIIKKEQGIDLQQMTNREKTLLIDALRGKYALNELLAVVGMAKSSYFYQRGVLSQADKHHSLRGKIIELFNVGVAEQPVNADECWL